MAYSFTEKKRIRKDFAKQPAVLEMPFLLATQLDSYRQFLQVGIDVDKRAPSGLHAAFSSVFPMASHSGSAALEYVVTVWANRCSTKRNAVCAAWCTRRRCA